MRPVQLSSVLQEPLGTDVIRKWATTLIHGIKPLLNQIRSMSPGLRRKELELCSVLWSPLFRGNKVLEWGGRGCFIKTTVNHGLLSGFMETLLSFSSSTWRSRSTCCYLTTTLLWPVSQLTWSEPHREAMQGCSESKLVFNITSTVLGECLHQMNLSEAVL